MSFDPRVHVAFIYYLSGTAVSLMSRRKWFVDLALPQVLPLGWCFGIMLLKKECMSKFLMGFPSLLL